MSNGDKSRVRRTEKGMRTSSERRAGKDLLRQAVETAFYGSDEDDEFDGEVAAISTGLTKGPGGMD